jgi:hypothetical protein
MTTQTSPMFELVKNMNLAFGNEALPRHDANEYRARLLAQCKNIGAEFMEMMEAFGVHARLSITADCADSVDGIASVSNIVTSSPPFPNLDEDEIRDALCDIMVFALGAYHLMDLDADADMKTVVDSVMTRFCKDTGDLLATEAMYKQKGVRYTIHGEYPRVYLRSAEDQQMPEYPKGKFLKSASYRKPLLTPRAATTDNAFEDMRRMREEAEREDRAWAEYRTACRDELEKVLDTVPRERRKDLRACVMTVNFQG